MKSKPLCLLLLLGAALFASPCSAQNLLKNGKFDHPANPFEGWITDYAWSGNSNYIRNKKWISVVNDGTRKNVVKFEGFPKGAQGGKMECIPFPLESGFRYTCSLNVKGGSYRLYFAGYRWAPGVRPHDNPELGELRMIYQSKDASGMAKDWSPVKFEIPGVKLSDSALEHLRQVRFLTIYIWFMNPGFVDNIVLTKTPDPAMKLE